MSSPVGGLAGSGSAGPLARACVELHAAVLIADVAPDPGRPGWVESLELATIRARRAIELLAEAACGGVLTGSQPDSMFVRGDDDLVSQCGVPAHASDRRER